MPRVVLIESNQKIEQVYRLNLEVYVGLEVKTFKNATDTLKFLKENTCDLIITKNLIKGITIAQEVISFLKTSKLTTPVIVIGDGKHPDGKLLGIPGSLDLKLVVKSAADALGITAQNMVNKKVDNFFAIPMDYFEFIDYPVCEIYKKELDQSYSTIYTIDKKIVQGEIKKLKSQNVPSLFIDRNDRLKMVNHISAEIMTQLSHDDLDENEQIQVLESNMELVNRKMLSIGISEETIAQAEKNIESLQKIAKQNPKLSILLSRMQNNKSGYIYLHTQALTYITIHMIRNVDWGNKEQEEKVTFISYFHDISLENDIQANINSTEELKASKLPPREITLVEKHAQLSAELVSKFPHAPMGADQIIKQHHGTLNGLGFSDNLNGNLSPMTMIFIIGEEFTKKLLMNPGKEIDKNAAILELKEKYPAPRFKKVIDLLDSITV